MEANITLVEKLYTIDEVSDLLHQRPSTIRTYIRQGRIRGTPVGKAWFVMDSDLQAFLERQRDEAEEELARRQEKAKRAAETRAANKRADEGAP